MRSFGHVIFRSTKGAKELSLTRSMLSTGWSMLSTGTSQVKLMKLQLRHVQQHARRCQHVASYLSNSSRQS